MKKYLFGILAISLAVGFSAFTTKKAHKPFTSATYYYVDGTNYQRVENGVSTPIGVVKAHSMNLDPQYNTANAAFLQAGNWTKTPQGGTAYAGSDGSSYLFTIEFNEDPNFTDDNDDSDGILLSQVLTEVYSRIIASGPSGFVSFSKTFDTNGATGAVTITITRAENHH